MLPFFFIFGKCFWLCSDCLVGFWCWILPWRPWHALKEKIVFGLELF